MKRKRNPRRRQNANTQEQNENVSGALCFRVKNEDINDESYVKPLFIPKHMGIYISFTKTAV